MKRKAIYWHLGALIGILLACSEPNMVLETEEVIVETPNDIIPLTDSLVQPIIYENIPSFEGLTVKETKEKFIAAVLPAILIAKHKLNEDRQLIKELANKKKWTATDSSFYMTQMERFEASDIEGLLKRMETHPNSIILAQAAVESGWGSSRFFQEANNLFGVWSYNPGEPRISASLTRGENKIYLRKYHDVSESILDYFETVGRARAYRTFRETRAQTKDVNELLPLLRYYSERRDAYVAQLATIIRQNDLMKYDNYQLDPRYFVES